MRTFPAFLSALPGSTRKGAWAVGVALACGGGSVAHADEADHDRALQAVQRGEALPLNTLMGQVEALRTGQILEVELERKHGRWVYEVKKLDPGGRLVKLHLDARTGALLDPNSRPKERTTP
ncbi:MAG TPA: PepSY domain-containing protein [Burkholderiaceae bacterium]|nr:PepSY domain-containing protein [Burkholderiaceae bacterium]